MIHADISIIIPVYNTSRKMLARCFESIHKQMASNIELVVVDDGSKVNCAEFLEQCRKIYGFQLIHQQNSGVSCARNRGIEVCTGEYIMFVDADDFLEADILKHIVEFSKEGADIVLGGINKVKEDKVQRCGIEGSNTVVYSREQIAKVQRYMLSERCDASSAELSGGLQCSGPWAKLIKRALLTNIRFDENLSVYEDLMFNLSALDEASVVIVDNKIWYNYCLYANSAMHKFRENGIEEILSVIYCLKKFANIHGKEFGPAIAIKTMECLWRLFSGTIFRPGSVYKGNMAIVKDVLNDSAVINLLKEMDETQYPAAGIKEKLMRFMFRRKMALSVTLYYSIKQWMMRNTETYIGGHMKGWERKLER